MRWKCFFLLFLSTLFVSTIGCNCDDQAAIGSSGKLATNQPGNTVLFSNIQVNQKHTISFILYNEGERELTVSSLKMIDDTQGVFKLLNPPQTPFTLASGKTSGKRITVQFNPSSARSFEGRIQVESSDASNVTSEGMFYVSVRHQKLTADLKWSCNGTLRFDSVEKGKKQTKECTVRNRGNADLIVRKIEYIREKGGKNQDFKWETPQLPFTLKMGDSKGHTVRVTYAPSDYPPQEDQGFFALHAQKDAKASKSSTHRLHVVARTAVAQIQLLPKQGTCTHDAECRRIDRRLRCSKDTFSNQKICQQAPNTTPVLTFPLTSKGKKTHRVFRIRNVGKQELIVERVQLSQSSSIDFRVAPSGVSFPLKIAPQKEKEIRVEYTPSDDVEDKGKIVVFSNAGNLPKAPILLEGAARGCNLDVLPRQIDFTHPKTAQITIINKGNEPCVVDRVYLKSGQPAPYSLLPVPQPNQTLVPSGTLSFLVKFKPTSNKPISDTVLIESSDPDEPKIHVKLNGRVLGNRPCQLDTSTQTVHYGLVAAGRSRKKDVLIQNKGYGDCILQSITLSHMGPAAFRLSSPPSTPHTLAAGRTLRLSTSFTPPLEKPGFEGRIQIQSNDSKQPSFHVRLLGSSGTLCLEIVPPNMDFGSTKFGCSAPKRSIEVFNLGASSCQKDIRITGLSLQGNKQGEFGIQSAPTLPRTMRRGHSIRIELSYKAKDLGVDTATLHIENNVAGQSPLPVPLVGEGVSTSKQTDFFKQLNRPIVDIMFVVDDSFSMNEEQQSLANNFESFINWAVRLNVDYQIMVTTTDVLKTGPKAPGCARGTTKIVTPQTPNPIQTFQQNVKVGVKGSGKERGLEAAYRALIPPASLGCNKGFYRQKASLSLIFVSDEPDQSPQPVQFYISFFKALKGRQNLDLIRASAVVGPPPSGCNAGQSGRARSGPRYWEVSTKLKGVQESICSSNWAATLSNIGSITFGYRSQFFLTRQADPKTIVVKVDGQIVPQDPNIGWTYNASDNSILFSKPSIPRPGTTTQVSYLALCLP